MDMAEIDRAVLVSLWPPERVVMGLRVCTWVRELLLESKDRVLLHLKGGQRHAYSAIGTDLVRFRCPALQVQLSGTGHSCKTFLYYVASGMALARSSEHEWTGSFDAITLTSIGRGWAGMYNSSTMSWFGRGLVAGESLYSFLGECTSSLETLDLSHNDGIQDRKLAEVLKRCENLKVLKLQHTLRSSGVSALCSVIGQCSKLVALDLRDNRILERSLAELITELEKCPELESLNLSRNDLRWSSAQSIAKSLAKCSKLKALHLSGEMPNQVGMHILPNCLNSLTTLTDLNLSKQLLGNPGAENLAELLIKSPHLEHLTLEAIGLDALGVFQLTGGLERCFLLQTLDVSGNDIKADGAARLGQALPACSLLSVLRLNNCGIPARGVAYLAAPLHRLSRLLDVDLGQNPALEDDQGACSSGSLGALVGGLQPLTHLRLARVQRFSSASEEALLQAATAAGYRARTQQESTALLDDAVAELMQALCAAGGSAPSPRHDPPPHQAACAEQREELEGAVEDVEGFTRGLQQCAHLRWLDLEQCGLRDQGAFYVTEAVARGCPWLEHLDLTENWITLSAAKWRFKLMGSLGRCTSLSSLHLKRNPLQPAGAAVLAGALCELTQLRRLDVSHTMLGPAGTGKLAEVVGLSSTLVELRCGRNGAGCAGATGMSDALQRQPHIEILDLSDNEIGDEGGAELAEAAMANGAERKGGLRQLLLARNAIGDGVAERLMEVVQQSRRLQRLDLRQNPVSQTTLDCLDVLCC